MVAFWPSFAVPHLKGRTDVLPSFGCDIADIEGIFNGLVTANVQKVLEVRV